MERPSAIGGPPAMEWALAFDEPPAFDRPHTFDEPWAVGWLPALGGSLSSPQVYLFLMIYELICKWLICVLLIIFSDF